MHQKDRDGMRRVEAWRSINAPAPRVVFADAGQHKRQIIR